jgi:hypothetical protein
VTLPRVATFGTKKRGRRADEWWVSHAGCAYLIERQAARSPVHSGRTVIAGVARVRAPGFVVIVTTGDTAP